MSADVVRLQRSGVPQTLLENALDEAHDMEFVMMVFVRKDGTIETEWSATQSLKGLGAVEVLRAAFLEECF